MGASSSFTSSFFSSSSFTSSSAISSSTSSPASFFRAASLAFLAASAFRRFSTTIRFLSSSCAFLLAWAAAFARLSAIISSCTLALYSALGLPIRTMALFLKPCAANFARMALRSAAMRLDLSSGTTKLRRISGEIACRAWHVLESLSAGMPSLDSGWSLEPGVVPGCAFCRQTPLSLAHSWTLRSLSSVCPGFFALKSPTQSK
mmetsp:Transcript_97184/g.251412  ORF Transcript_97184/g.251412 Transcript_97184/m.251412 type:complete len:204 (-) Transcript_97184:911-1522(-)